MAGDSTIPWDAVTGLRNGDNVDADTLNTPIQQLAARTELLWRLMSRNDRTKVVIQNATVSDPERDGLPTLGQPVYRRADGTYAKAKGRVRENAWFYADQCAMVVGVIGEISGTTADIILSGYVSLGDGVPVSRLIADRNPESGRYYLAGADAAGKLTSGPSGPVIYVCDCTISGGKVMSMIVNPQYRDTGESHIHRSFTLSGMPVGGYGVKTMTSATAGTFSASYILPTGIKPTGETSASDDIFPPVLAIIPYGMWDTDSQITYSFSITGSGSAWSGYTVNWSSGGVDGSGTIDLSIFNTSQNAYNSTYIAIGTHGFKILFTRLGDLYSSGVMPSIPSGVSVNPAAWKWSVTMPDAGRAWLHTTYGFRLNLGMYPDMARYVPPVPENGAALTVDGIEMRGVWFGETGTNARQWAITGAAGDGGPWLQWYGRSVVANGDTVTTPFNWTANNVLATPRAISLHLNRMRVGPTGFVTSLEAAPGSPFRITSALTDSVASQGALQIGFDVNFRSSEGNVPGFQVVKRINGATFETGPVVERVIAGPGIAVSQEQGSVTLSVSNAAYAGDFETIALKNAKQDLAGGVFPYTKLLGWTGAGSINSGFTAKFRVPDHIPYKAYYVVVSASVFGEAGVASGAGTESAAFSLQNYTLVDQACASLAPAPGSAGAPDFGGSIASPSAGLLATIVVPFTGPYAAYDPVLVHGFSTGGPGSLALDDNAQRHADASLWLRDSENSAIKVYPGYFVGLDIKRCGASGATYSAPIGFLSLRWNLVEV